MRPGTPIAHPPRAQRGAVAVFVAISIVALVLMIGLVLDLGHIFIVKNELQNAADSCALSAARELNDLGPGATDRATSAGITAGTRNRADLQADLVAIQPAEVTFSAALAGPYSRAIAATTRYVRCAPHETQLKSVVMWFMRVAGFETRLASADAIARLVPGQSFCAIPLAMCSDSPTAADLVVGQWYRGRMAPGTAQTGNYDWIRFDGQGARDIKDLLCGDGFCAQRPDIVDSEPGSTQGVAAAWNTRFGVYGHGGPYSDPAVCVPDRTGVAYALPNWVAGKNAYPDFEDNRGRTPHVPFDPNSIPDKLPGNPVIVTPNPGGDRRMVAVPVVNCSNWKPNGKNMPVIAYACVLMLAPIPDPDAVVMEFRGLESQPNDCASGGTPGESGLPVPALVN